MTATATRCLDPTVALDFIERRLTEDERAIAEAHVASCGDCRQLLAVAADEGVGLAATMDESVLPSGADDDEAYCSVCGDSFAPDRDVCPKDGARLTKLVSQLDPMIGRVFDDRYEVRAALGQGGMGAVYRGWQRSVDREVAIKVIHHRLANDRDTAKRFLRESRLSSRLSQPSVVSVYDCGQADDGTLYIVMELVRGRPLSALLTNGQSLSLQRTLTIALQLCDALTAAHGQDIIHRDLKPGNIVVLDEPAGRDLIKVLDFGLAKSLSAETSSITHTRAVIGTPLYMSPEQVEGAATDQRADLYSLGCILFHLVTGRPPFVASSVNAVLAAHVNTPPPPLPAALPPALTQVIEQLLAKAPADRPASAAVVHEALVACERELELELASPHVASSPAGRLALDTAAIAAQETAAQETPAQETAATAVAATGASDSRTSADDASAPPRRRWLVVAGVLVVGGVLAIGLARRGAPSPSGETGSMPPPLADAAVIDRSTPSPVDAPPDVLPEAAIDAPIDAAVVAPTIRDRPRRGHPPADAAPDGPTIDFLRAP